MDVSAVPAFVAAAFCTGLALEWLRAANRSVAGASFCAGMLLFALSSMLSGVSLFAAHPVPWKRAALLAESLTPAVWLVFALAYSRGDHLDALRRWRFHLMAAACLPVLLCISALSRYSFPGERRLLVLLLLAGAVLVLGNLEKTLRAAVGIVRWRIKFLVLGLIVIFGARVYSATQVLLYSNRDFAVNGVDRCALIVGGVLIAFGFVRSGFSECDLYPSRGIAGSSATLLLVGGYLFCIGVLAQAISYMGGVGSFQTQALGVLAIIAVSAVLMFSDRLRVRLLAFLSRRFERPRYDSRKLWKLFAERLSSILDRSRLCSAAANHISETFNILSVTIWITDPVGESFVFGATTAPSQPRVMPSAAEILSELRNITSPWSIEYINEEWAETLRSASPRQFRDGGDRFVVPIISGDRWLGAAVLADRVNGVRFTQEELDLLECIGRQLGAALLNLALSEELLVSKEMEAFQTMSAFFVHDLKNAASSLGLTLRNLPIHFEDPAFREDALRTVSGVSRRINQMIDRLSALRNRLEIKPAPVDLNRLVRETLQVIDGRPEIEVVQDLQPLPQVVADPEQIQTVFTNLLLNAADAVGKSGRVTVKTCASNGNAVLIVADDGCGMSPVFVQDSLFRPFHTTKKKGIGIGMFQSKMIIDAHRGRISVKSEPGKGTTFEITLPCLAQT